MKKSVLKIVAMVLAMVMMLAMFASCSQQGEQGPAGPTGPQGEQGDTGNGVKSIVKTSTEGLVDTYTITFTDGTTTTFTVTNGANGEQGIQGIQGVKGEDGHTPVITIQNGYWYIDGVNTNQSATGFSGATGNGISNIAKTSTEGLVDTYTITYTNGTTTTFTVTNGADGAQGVQGIQGEKGADGHTPVITIQNGKWYIDGVDSGKSAEGIKGDTGNGISSIAKTNTVGLIDIYTITYTNGETSTFTVTNGADGAQGQQGVQGIQGEKGADGHTPVITIQNGRWYIDGVDSGKSAEGVKGDTGNGISSIEKTKTEGLVDTYTITFTNGDKTTFTVTNGAAGAQGQQGIQGIQGEKGADGHTPVITIQNGKWYIDGVDSGKSAEGVKGDTGNGISSIVKTNTAGLVDTYTITYTNGEKTTFTVTNGADGAQGQQGIQGIQGEKGADGHTPVITIQNGKWYIDGVDTGVLAEGIKGETGNGISSIVKTKTEGLVDTYTITFTNGNTTNFTVTNGAQGEPGVGIANAYINSDVHLILVLTNGTTIDAGYVGVNVTPIPTTYIVTFVDYNGTVLKTETVESGKDATAPADPIRAGYTFIGWNGSYTNVTSNLTITAQYNEPPKFVVSTATTSAGTTDVVVTVSIENNPGILGMVLKLNYDDSILTLTKATKGAALYSHSLTKPGQFVDGCNFVIDTMELEEEDYEDGIILTFKFTVSGSAPAGSYDIEISYEPNAIKDSNYQPINNIVVENGKIIVQ